MCIRDRGEDARERVIEQVENLPIIVDTARIIDDLQP